MSCLWTPSFSNDAVIMNEAGHNFLRLWPAMTLLTLLFKTADNQIAYCFKQWREIEVCHRSKKEKKQSDRVEFVHQVLTPSNVKQNHILKAKPSKHAYLAFLANYSPSHPSPFLLLAAA